MSGLSLVLGSRNDNYTGNPMERLRTVLEYIEKHFADKDVEVIIGDWGSEIPIAEVVPEYDFLKFAYISPDITRSMLENCPVDFSEVLAVQAAARKATGDHIGRIDQDTILGPKFVDWYYNTEHDPNDFYFCTRREMPENVFTLDSANAPHDSKRPTGFEFWRDAVGIFLIPQSMWFETTGYDQKNVLGNHMEHEYVMRLSRVGRLVNIGPSIDWEAFHIWHSRDDCKARPRNNQLSTLQLKQLPLIANTKNWGIYT